MRSENKPNGVLRQQRLKRGWSLQRVADALYELSLKLHARHCGANGDMIGEWERGIKVPSPFYRELLCHLYEMDAEQLGFMGPPKNTFEAIDMFVLIKEGDKKHDSSKICSYQILEADIVNRREATKQLGALSLPLITSPLTQAAHLLHNEEILSICVTNIPICWRLYFDGHLSEVHHVLLPLYIPQLAALTNETGYQERAASVASKAFLLAAVIEMHYRNNRNALINAQQGVFYGKLAADLNLQIASLIQQGNIYFSLKQPLEELEAYQKAHHLCQKARYSSEVSPLLRGRVYIGLAKAYSQFKEEKESLHCLSMAHERYPEHPEEDSAFSYTCHSRFTLDNHTGLTYLNLDQPQSAWDIFAKIDKILPTKLVPRRMELFIRQATISLALDNLKESCTYLESAISSAMTLGSNLRFNEAYVLYLSLCEKWGNEQPVKKLGKYFGL